MKFDFCFPRNSNLFSSASSTWFWSCLPWLEYIYFIYLVNFLLRSSLLECSYWNGSYFQTISVWAVKYFLMLNSYLWIKFKVFIEIHFAIEVISFSSLFLPILNKYSEINIIFKSFILKNPWNIHCSSISPESKVYVSFSLQADVG